MRRLGVFDLILIGIGASIGAGIFVVTGTVARDAGPGEYVVKVFDEMPVRVILFFYIQICIF